MNPMLMPALALAVAAAVELAVGDPIAAFQRGAPAAAVALLAIDRSRRDRLAREAAALPGADLL